MSLSTRREFAKLALAALPGAAAWSGSGRLFAAEKPNSKVNGVQIGMNVPYSFGPGNWTGDEILKNCLELGLSGVELRSQSVELFLGAPVELVYGAKKKDKKDKKDKAEPEPKAKPTGSLREWRKTAPMDKVKDYRAKFEDAGVLIEVVKVDGLFKMSDEELDYAFTMVKALGAHAMSSEISHEEAELKRLGSFADKHQLMVGYHGHATTTPEHWETAFAVAKYNGANVDLGHFVAGNNTSPVPFLKKYHERVTHVHVKDRGFKNGPAVAFGKGDTPLPEILRLIRDEKWPIQATIEFEYKVPADSDRMKELAKCIAYCRKELA